MYAFETSLDGHDGWILGHDGANRLLLSACARPQIVWWGRIKTSKAKIIRARLGKEGGGGGKNRLI